MTWFIFQVVPSDAGRYVCTLETFPKKSLFLLLQVNGELMVMMMMIFPTSLSQWYGMLMIMKATVQIKLK